MIYNYEFTELAINDIDETLNYITNILCNKKAAVDLMKDIEKSIYNICMFPLAYPDCKYYYINSILAPTFCNFSTILSYPLNI